MVEEILCGPRTFEYVRPRRGGAKKFTEPMKRKFPRNYSLRTSGEREGGGERRERGKKKKSRISNSTPKAEFLNERGANNARVFASSHLRLNEKEREGKATRIWVSGTWSAREYKRHVEIITTNATRERILVAAKMAMVAKENAGERERKDGGMARYF